MKASTILILAAVGGGAYYLWRKRKPCCAGCAGGGGGERVAPTTSGDSFSTFGGLDESGDVLPAGLGPSIETVAEGARARACTS